MFVKIEKILIHSFFYNVHKKNTYLVYRYVNYVSYNYLKHKYIIEGV